MLTRDELVNFINDLLNIGLYKDYCPNGLQVEGSGTVTKIISGVTASQALIDVAIDRKADALLVHHGFFWKGENPCLCGIKRKRLAALLGANVNVLVYHLPLDAHPSLGNNAQLARLMGIEVDRTFGPELPHIGLIGHTTNPMSATEFGNRLNQRLSRTPLHLVGDARKIKTVAICTGGAQNYFQAAIDANVDAFITGEVSEYVTHAVRETGVHYYAAGHHATERYGVIALGDVLQKQFNIDHEFIDIDNPV